MAQSVGYMENNVTYLEGPFVMVYAGGWRIEVELKDFYCPVMMDYQIYKLLELENLFRHKTEDRELVAKSVDWLNQKVREGEIVLIGKQWLPNSLGK